MDEKSLKRAIRSRYDSHTFFAREEEERGKIEMKDPRGRWRDRTRAREKESRVREGTRGSEVQPLVRTTMHFVYIRQRERIEGYFNWR